MKLLKSLKNNWPLVIVLSLTLITRFGGLTWCFPFAPHPDEWNMAAAITRLDWHKSLNPHFFAYGQFPLYLSYFSATFYNFIAGIKTRNIDISQAIFFLRFWSATAGTGLVFLVYLISKKLSFRHPVSLVTAVLAVFTPGLIQTSHFGTTESILGFFFLIIIYLTILIIEKQKFVYFFWLSLVLSLSLGTKITALFFFTPVIFSFFASKSKKYFLFLFLTPFLTLLVSPYLWLSFKESLSTLTYETAVATGKSPVFYTRQFIKTKPIFFQLQRIFPYVLGWPIFILGTVGFILGIISLAKKSKHFSQIIYFAFLIYFFSQAFLFTKWTRFVSPVFAFFPIFSGFLLNAYKKTKHLLMMVIIILAIIPGVIFASVYFSPDIRFTASGWIYEKIPSGSQILYDTGNAVDLPLNPNHQTSIANYSLVSFDFYHLDEDPELFPKLLDSLEKSNFIIVPSRRIFLNHLRFPEKFPKTTKYYQLLFSGDLGFTPVAKIEPFYSKIFNDELAEETFSVFDHPTIRIYQKNNNLSRSQYEILFKN